MALPAGWSKPDDCDSLGAAAVRIAQIDRANCRALVETRYTLPHYGAALADWLRTLTAERPIQQEQRMSGPDGQRSWTLHIRKDNLKFAAAHMTVFPDGRKENLHGHNYQVELEVALAAPPTLALMLSYEVFKQALRTVCAAWDEKVLIAGDNPWLEWLAAAMDDCAFRLCGKRYVLPAEQGAGAGDRQYHR